MEYTPYLYLLMRNDLDSMNAGKMVAHGAHAANQFRHEVQLKRRATSALDVPTSAADVILDRQTERWENSAIGFGTTITLSVSLEELLRTTEIVRNLGFMANKTVDPTYPYVLHREYAALIDHSKMVNAEVLANFDVPAGNNPTPIGNDMMLCLREEVTGGYVFGDKDLLKPYLQHFPLMP